MKKTTTNNNGITAIYVRRSVSDKDKGNIRCPFPHRGRNVSGSLETANIRYIVTMENREKMFSTARHLCR